MGVQGKIWVGTHPRPHYLLPSMEILTAFSDGSKLFPRDIHFDNTSEIDPELLAKPITNLENFTI